MLPNERTTREEVAATPGVVDGLVVARNRDAARPSIEFLRAEGINVQFVTSSDLGLEEALLHRPNVILVDESISRSGGVDLCERLKSNTRTHFLPTILVAQGRKNDLLRLTALAAGVDAVFSASIGHEERRVRLWALLRSQAAFRRLERKRQSQSSAISDKRRWVRGLIHDIQNSLSAIQANFEFVAQQSDIRDKKLRAEFEECVVETRGTFRETVRNLRTVLMFERFEAGDIVLDHGKVLLSEVTESVVSTLGPMATSLDKTILVDNSSYSSPVLGDEKYLYEAVSSLATFVLRQSDNRRCFLQASSEAGVARLRVYGDQHHISAAARRGIFDPFVGPTKDKPTRAAHQVGLALARNVVEAHHGSIRVEDSPSAGSAFVLEFPAHWPAREQRSPE
jgi:K+-sensing histidine kinase KdpD